MHRTPVTSSALKSVGYEERVLGIEYVQGQIYDYLDVPRPVYEALMQAESKGRYVKAQVKNHYRYRPVPRGR
ncbi:KTSC domain-containing protein [Streptomyces sp. ICBB 8177]|uniref:KTSC domain-containing protein n=1 Tax=Streptomyces sp. ICBB 8177 TaxID=563922 RepID=UPI000D678E2C|nr:KTSC domain-containing protein [Streptomyces sp. ICBB 8177]PWI45266.1 KTSC domain-containing protein [Streptomyces sp. ICBB 8177]